jgi:hypothetical protein
MKDAIYYQMTGDVEAGDRIPDPHPELLRYLVPPRDVVERAREEGVVQALRRAMNIKKGKRVSLSDWSRCVSKGRGDRSDAGSFHSPGEEGQEEERRGRRSWSRGVSLTFLPPYSFVDTGLS